MSLKGFVVVFSGIRDRLVLEVLEAEIEKRQGFVAKAVSGKTTMLIVKDGTENDQSVKVQKAKSLGISIVGVQLFAQTYLEKPQPQQVKREPSPKLVVNAGDKVIVKGKAKIFRLNIEPSSSVEHIVKVTKSKLKHGDVIVFDDEDRMWHFVVDSGNGMKLVKNKEEYCKIPLEVTRHLNDAIGYYKNVIQDLLVSAELDGIALSRSDVFLQKIFKKPSKIQAEASFSLIYDDRDDHTLNTLMVTYNGESQVFEKSVNQATLEAAFGAKNLESKVKLQLVFTTRCDVYAKNPKIDYEVRPTVSTAWIKKQLPSDNWKLKGGDNAFVVEGPYNELDLLKKALSAMAIA
jgi:hypothetical protein